MDLHPISTKELQLCQSKDSRFLEFCLCRLF